LSERYVTAIGVQVDGDVPTLPAFVVPTPATPKSGPVVAFLSLSDLAVVPASWEIDRVAPSDAFETIVPKTG